MFIKCVINIISILFFLTYISGFQAFQFFSFSYFSCKFSLFFSLFYPKKKRKIEKHIFGVIKREKRKIMFFNRDVRNTLILRFVANKFRDLVRILRSRDLLQTNQIIRSVCNKSRDLKISFNNSKFVCNKLKE